MKVRIALLIVLVVPLTGLIPQQPRSPGSRSEVLALLEESHNLSRQFDEINRIWYLGDLLNISIKIAPEKVESLADELFNVSLHSKLDRQARIANEKVALVPLSRISPEKAMSMFASIEDLEKGTSAAEDVRAHAARFIFVNFFSAKGLEGLPEIERQAVHIGETGEYPYQAMGLIVKELAQPRDKESKNVADEILGAALKYYEKDSLILNKDSEFLFLLESSRDQANPALFRQAVETFVAHVLEKIKSETSGTEKTEIYKSEIRLDGKVISLSSQSLTLLFRAFPLVSDTLGASNVAQLMKTYPELRAAAGNVENIASTVVRSDLPPDQIAALQRQGLQDSVLVGIQNLERANPKLALRLARTLQDPSARIIGVSTALSGLASIDQRETKEAYDSELKDLDQIKDDDQKVRAMAALAKAAYYAQDYDSFNYLTTQVVEKAFKVFDKSVQDNPKRPADSLRGYDELTDVTEFTVAHNFDWMMKGARDAKSDVLKAHLLMYAAKGMAERATAIATMKPKPRL
jgi:hypothetical protein